jgi:uncharacterized protein
MTRDMALEQSPDATWGWRLPAEPHIPGRNARPDDAEIDLIARAAPRPTDPAAWRDNEAYRAGLRLYAYGYYWEAHEVWEPVWMHASLRSQERELTQGLIQIANAALKLRMEQPKAARRLAAIAEKHFREAAFGASSIVMGVDLSGMTVAASAFAENLNREDNAPPPNIPLVGLD